MERVNGSRHEEIARTISRRDALKRGAVLTGAVAWTVPAVQAIALSSASADDPSGTPPPPPPGQEPTGKVPSHAIFLVEHGGVVFALQFYPTSEDEQAVPGPVEFDKVGPPEDREYLTDKHPDLDIVFDKKSGKTPTGLQGVIDTFNANGAGAADVNPDTGERALVLQMVPGYAFVDGYAFDGGNQEGVQHLSKYRQYAQQGQYFYFFGE